jgi:DNA-binding response OmpR family regulator
MHPGELKELPGEDLETQALSEVASWIAIYQELENVQRAVLVRQEDLHDGADLRASLAWVEGRLELWRRRHASLAGIQVDPENHTVTYAGRTVQLTHRETDLLAFLVAHPDRPFSSKQLTALAWNNARLSDAQVRTYMMRLRKRLEEIGLGSYLRAVKRRGYKLEPPTGN